MMTKDDVVKNKVAAEKTGDVSGIDLSKNKENTLAASNTGGEDKAERRNLGGVEDAENSDGLEGKNGSPIDRPGKVTAEATGKHAVDQSKDQAHYELSVSPKFGRNSYESLDNGYFGFPSRYLPGMLESDDLGDPISLSPEELDDHYNGIVGNLYNIPDDDQSPTEYEPEYTLDPESKWRFAPSEYVSGSGIGQESADNMGESPSDQKGGEHRFDGASLFEENDVPEFRVEPKTMRDFEVLDKALMKVAHASELSAQLGYSFDLSRNKEIKEAVGKGFLRKSQLAQAQDNVFVLAQWSKARAKYDGYPFNVKSKLLNEEFVNYLKTAKVNPKNKYRLEAAFSNYERQAREYEKKLFELDPAQYVQNQAMKAANFAANTKFRDPYDLKTMNRYLLRESVKKQKQLNPDGKVRYWSDTQTMQFMIDFAKATPNQRRAMALRMRKDNGDFYNYIIEELNLTPKDFISFRVGPFLKTQIEKNLIFFSADKNQAWLRVNDASLEKEVMIAFWKTPYGASVQKFLDKANPEKIPEWLRLSVLNMRKYAVNLKTKHHFTDQSAVDSAARVFGAALEKAFGVISDDKLGHVVYDGDYRKELMYVALNLVKANVVSNMVKADPENAGQIKGKAVSWENEGEDLILVEKLPGGRSVPIRDGKGRLVWYTPMELMENFMTGLSDFGVDVDKTLSNIRMATPWDNPEEWKKVYEYGRQVETDNMSDPTGHWTKKGFDFNQVLDVFMQTPTGSWLIKTLQENNVKIRAVVPPENDPYQAKYKIGENTIQINVNCSTNDVIEFFAQECKHALDHLVIKKENDYKKIVERQKGKSNFSIAIEYWGHLCDLVQLQILLAHNVYYSEGNIADRPQNSWNKFSQEAEAFQKGNLKELLMKKYPNMIESGVAHSTLDTTDPFHIKIGE